MKGYLQEVVDSIDGLNEMIHELEQIQDDLSEDMLDYQHLEAARLKLLEAKKELMTIQPEQ